MALLRRLTDGQKRNLGHWAMEFAIVVVGVLVALWLQQWAERRRELAGMHAAEEAIHD
jgi:apolipoprotein N-acyltransferase